MAADEAKAVAQLEDEALQALDQPVFQLALFHRLADAQKFQTVAALHHLIRLFGEMLGHGEREVVRLLFLDGALVGAGFDLVEQDTARPAKLRRGAQVVKAGGGVVYLVENQPVMTPRNLCDKLPQKLSDRGALIQFGHSLWPKLALPGGNALFLSTTLIVK